MHAQLIDALRAQIWMSDLCGRTEHDTPLRLGRHLQTLGLGTDDPEVLLSKCYRIAAGRQTPRRTRAERIEAALALTGFPIHHKVWRLLRSPGLSDRSLAAFRASMPAEWQASLKQLSSAPSDDLAVGNKFVKIAGLRHMGFFDALLLLACALRVATRRAEQDRQDRLSAILLMLPLVYWDEPFWVMSTLPGQKPSKPELRYRIGLIDTSISRWPGFSDAVRFPAPEKARALLILRALAAQEVAQHPRALRTTERRRGFAARFLERYEGRAFCLAFSAYRDNGGGPLEDRSLWKRPIDKRAWQWAWCQIDLGCDPIEQRPAEIEAWWIRRHSVRTS